MVNDPERTVNDATLSGKERIKALEGLTMPPVPSVCKYVNNHIHTSYSFSPYTPAAAVLSAARAGLSTAGIMDHDSVGGLKEFCEASAVVGIPVTCGFECRTSVAGTPLEGRRLNCPDQKSVAYVTMHGIPHTMIQRCDSVLAPLRAKRNERNIKMCRRLSTLCGCEIDFERDVLPLSMYACGGSVTERHLLFALAKKLLSPGSAHTVSELEHLGVQVPAGFAQRLDTEGEYRAAYDVLGLLKSSLIEKVYIDADDELMHISEFTALAREIGAIPAYAYLGDVTASPTGDKKAQSFEDSYLDLLFDTLHGLGIEAVTYMPSRNTAAQLERIAELCERHSFFQVSGEDINSPSQSFVCEAMTRHPGLIESTWALIGHEISATDDLNNGMFSSETKKSLPSLHDRIAYFADIGRKRGCNFD